MRKVTLVLGTHNHIPLGMDQESAERTYQSAFKPLLAVLYSYPDFPLALHYSGVLMDWLEEYHPEFLMLLEEMVKRGQVEILGGGYFDPILPIIPTNDKLGQLEKLTTWLRAKFEVRPRGCWIAENVWEPSLASVLRVSGMDYTFLDDVQFRAAGARDQSLFQPQIAEDQGKIISVFPICGPLRAIAMTGDPAEAISYLKSLGNGGQVCPVAVLMEDGCHAAQGILRSEWLESFIRLAGESSDWLCCATPSRYLRDCPPSGRLYLPSSSSMEMSEWALAPGLREKYHAALTAGADGPEYGAVPMAGHFRQFFARYPEAWLMYAKMTYTHVLVNQVRGDRYKKKAAQNELWKGQSHYAYWQGARGGIYENVLRKAVYHSLIEAEKITRATEIFAPSIISVDFDMDNSTEYLYQGSELNAYIHARGGAMFELDFLPASWNYLDTMVARDAEAGQGGEAAAQPDSISPFARKAFLDHFFAPECTMEDFQAGLPVEAGDFVAEPYDLVELNRTLPELLMRRTGTVSANGAPRAAGIEKRFVFRPRSIDVYYKVTNLAEEELTARFGVEMNVSLADRSVENGRLFLIDEDTKSEIHPESQDIPAVQGLLVRDVRNEVSITLSSARAFRCWGMPLETAVPGAPERPPVFQSHCFIQQWELDLKPGESWENHLSVGFEKTQSA